MTVTKDFITALDAFIASAQTKVDAEFNRADGRNPILTGEFGQRYVRVVKDLYGDTRQRSVFCFVDTTNGDVLKAAGWKGPAKGTSATRSNVFDADHGVSGVTGYGAVYLR